MIISKERIKQFRELYPKGTRVKLVEMDDPQAPPVGTLGTVNFVDDAGTIHVSWDNGSSLGLIYPVDNFEVVKEEANER